MNTSASNLDPTDNSIDTDNNSDHGDREQTATSVAVLGLGAMGSRIATRIADAGFDVTVWNRSPEAANTLSRITPVIVAPTIAKAVGTADVVLSMVSDDNASGTLWLDPDHGALATMAKTAVAVEASTVTPAMAAELERAARTRGVAFLEAPVIGSRPQAEAGALLTLAGGDEAILDRVRPVLETYSGAIRAVGPVGNAATMKLVVNGLFGIQVAAYAEMVGLLAGSAMDIDTAIDILTGLPITSPGLQRILGLFADRAFAPNFPVALVAKDFGYLQALADGLGADIPVAAAAGSVYDQGASLPDGQPGPQAELDIAGIITRYVPH